MFGCGTGTVPDRFVSLFDSCLAGPAIVTDRDRVRQMHACRQAEGYLELEMPESALEILQQLGSPEQLGVHGLYLMGESLRSMERYCEALASLSTAAVLSPEDAHILLAMAWCYKRVGRLDRAIGAMQRALDHSPNQAILHYNLACYLSLTGEFQGSVRHLSRALRLQPGFREKVETEPDFDPIRKHPGFVALKSILV
jgi:tetratricopeptide (TPR) repeat protein